MLRLLGAGGTPLHRIRTGVEFAVSGRKRRRRHDRPARRARPAAGRASSTCPPRSATALGVLVRAVGRQGLARRARRRRRPARVPDRAAGGVRRGRPPHGRHRRRRATLARRASGTAVRSRPSSDAAARRRRESSTGSTTSAPGRRSSTPSRRSRVVLSAGRVRRGAAGDRRVRRPEVAVHARPLGRRGRAGRGRRPPPQPRRRRGARRCAGPGSCTSSAGWASPTRSGTSPARSAPGVGAGAAAPVLHRADAAAVRRRSRPLGRIVGAATRAPRRLRLPAGPARQRDLAARPGSSAPPTPTRRCARSGRTARRSPRPTAAAPSCEHRCGPGRLDADAVDAVLAAAGHRVRRRQEGPGRPHRPRGRGPQAPRSADCRTSRSPPGS